MFPSLCFHSVYYQIVLSQSRRTKPPASFPSSHFSCNTPPQTDLYTGTHNLRQKHFLAITWSLFNHPSLSVEKLLRIIKYQDNNYQREK